MRHPADETLALYAGDDLGLWARLRLAPHLRRCERCSRHVEEFREMREVLAAERDELPSGIEWNALASEMKANIRVGLAAGQCVNVAVEERVRSPWRTPAFALPVLLVVIAGWILQSLPPSLTVVRTSPAAAVMVLESGPAGIGVEQDGRGFRLLRPVAAENAVFSVRGESVRARYVDSETGQVTISHVYAE